MNNKIETKAMSIGILLNFIMAFAGIYMYLTTDINAIFLDGTFSLMEGTSCIVAVIITKFSAKEHKTFPNGLYILEPLYSLVKCFICFGLIAFSTYEATTKLYNYFVYNTGVPLELDAVVIYTVIMVTLCMILSYIFYLYNKKTNMTSTILTAETKTAFVDGMLSLGIGVTAFIIKFISIDSPLGFLYYIGDSAMTLALVLVVVREPVIILQECFVELTHGVMHKPAIVDPINAMVDKAKEDYKAFAIKDVKIYKTGKMLDVNLAIEAVENAEMVNQVKEYKVELLKLLESEFPLVSVNFII